MPRATHHEFLTWAQEHAAMFGMTKPEEKKAVQLWEATLASNGYSLSELRYASKLLSANPPKTRAEHIKHIHQLIGGLRKKAAQEEAATLAAIRDFEACRNCKGYGWVEVPHKDYLRDGDWIVYPGTNWKPTFAVTCSCDAGRRAAAGHSKNPRPTGLEHYEERNPDWRKQVEEYAEAWRSMRQAEAYTAAVDQSLGKLVREIGEKLATMPEEQSDLSDAERAARLSNARAPRQLRLYDETGVADEDPEKQTDRASGA